MKARNNQSELMLFKTSDEKIKIDVLLEDETVWLTQEQMSGLFEKGRSTITEHIGNVYKEGKLEQNQTCQKFRHVRKEGAREVEREPNRWPPTVLYCVLGAVFYANFVNIAKQPNTLSGTKIL